MLKHRRIHSGLYWKSKLKRGSFTGLTGDAYLASMRLDHLLNDSQTQTKSTSAFTIGFQFIEYLSDSIFRNAAAGIPNPASDNVERYGCRQLACPGSELPEPAAPYSATVSSIRNVVGGRVPPALSDSRNASLEFSNSDKIAALMYPNTGVADCQEAKHRANGECESTSIRGHGGGSTRP